jgi:hypothetical protein
MGLYLGAAYKLNLWNERLGKSASSDSSTKDGIEAVRLCAFAPPGSPLDRSTLCRSFSS